MNKYKQVFFLLLALTIMAIPAIAQDASQVADVTKNPDVMSYRALAAGLGFGLAAGLGAIGQSRIGAAAVEGAARNPGAAGTVQTMMIIGLALIESLVLLALVIVFAKL